MEQIGIGETLLGKYRIDAVLGRGVVYRGTTIATGRPVAVKALAVRDNVQDRARTTRFLREMKVIANLSSPYTVTLFDVGRSDNGVPFMVCELIDGSDLKTLLESRMLTEREAMHVLWQVLRSLAEAHEHGVLHRDIKPANIMVHEYDGDPLRVKVLDFGLAKSLDGEASLTDTGTVVGTPRYMSPEQVFGGPLTPAVDVYAAGLVAYDMLVGLDESRKLPPGRPRALEESGRLTLQTREIVNRMLAIDPRERFTDANEVLRAMSADRRPDPVIPLPTEEPPREPAIEESPRERRTIAAAAVGVVVGSAATLAAVMLVADDGEPIHPPIAKSTPEPRLPEARPTAEPEVVPKKRGGCGAPAPFTGPGMLRRVDGLDVRRVLAHVPPGYDASRPHGLVVLLHEPGSTPSRFMEISGFTEAHDEPLVIVAPQAAGTGLPWTADQKGRVTEAIATATSELCIDPERIYLIGHGTGGDTAVHAACDIPGVAAIATTASIGRMDAPAVCENAIAAIHLIGRDDGYNPIDGGENCSGVQKRSLADREQLWRARNGCAESAEVWSRDGESICQTWSCERAPLVSCVLERSRMAVEQSEDSRCDQRL